MSYTKTQWNPGGPPGISADNLNKIEEGIEAAHKLIETDPHTPDQSDTAQASGTLLKLQNYWANMLRRILGTANWHDAPPTTLTAAKSHIDAAAPHSGHETPTGAQAKVDSALAAVLDPVTGHRHSGEAGDGPPLPYDRYYAPSNALVASHDAQTFTYSTSDELLKRFTVPYGGRFKVEWESRSSDNNAPNGIPTYTHLRYAGYQQPAQAHGLPHDAWEKQTHEMTRDVSPGDTIELWGRRGTQDVEAVHVRNFRLFGSPVHRTFEIS